MGIALVSGQTASAINSGGAVTTLNVVLPNNPATGNLVVVLADAGGGSGLTAQDSNGNTYAATSKTPFTSTAPTAARIGILYLQNAPANASKTITITAGGASIGTNSFSVWAIEVSGAATTSVFENDATQDNGGPNATITTPSYTSTNDGDLYVAIHVAGASITSANSPWTGIDIVQNGNYAEFFVQSTHGLQAVAYTQNASSNWAGMVAAFKAAPVVASPSVILGPGGTSIFRARQFSSHGRRQIYG